MAKYRDAAGFWLSVAALAWTVMVIGSGLSLIASDPARWANDVLIPTLVLLAGVAFLFVRLALRFRRKGSLFVRHF